MEDVEPSVSRPRHWAGVVALKHRCDHEIASQEGSPRSWTAGSDSSADARILLRPAAALSSLADLVPAAQFGSKPRDRRNELAR